MLYTAHNTLDSKELDVIGQIEEARKTLSYALGSPGRWFGLLRRSTLARAIQGSNSIEGFNVSAEDAMAAVDGLEPTDAKGQDWQAVIGYRKAMTYVLQLANDPHFSFNEGFIRSLHFMMLEYDLSKNSGKWRPGHIYVRDDQKHAIVYEGPEASKVPSLISELIQSLNEHTNIPVMIRAALGHLNLVMIHPFSDGNGRMARCLQTLILAREGILAPQFSSIEEYLGHNTQNYYSTLAEVGEGYWSPHHDPKPWIRFCLTAHYYQAMTLLRRATETHRVWDQLEVEIKNRSLPDRSIPALMDAVFGYTIRRSIYLSHTDLTELSASRDLRQLVDAGMLIAEGDKRGRIYKASPILRSIRDRTREPHVIINPFTVNVDTLPLPGV